MLADKYDLGLLRSEALGFMTNHRNVMMVVQTTKGFLDLSLKNPKLLLEILARVTRAKAFWLEPRKRKLRELGLEEILGDDEEE